MMFIMPEREEWTIPEARLDDLDLDVEADRAIWLERLDALAERRIREARVRLETMGIIDREGRLISRILPPDMLPGSDSSIETG